MAANITAVLDVVNLAIDVNWTTISAFSQEGSTYSTLAEDGSAVTSSSIVTSSFNDGVSMLPVGGENSGEKADDAVWILTSTFIIFTMQSGFGLLESGSVTVKNEVNIMVKNAADVIFGGFTYWAFGYALSSGDDQKVNNFFFGWGNFFAITDKEHLGEVYSKFFFQASFATTATTIVSGAMAERVKLESYIVFSMLNTLVYCIPAHWVWDARGWLSRLGMVDIAGAGAVHLVGGVTGLVATVMLKPRHHRYNPKAPKLIMGSPTNALLGLFMLWWGWLGFNCGSTFGISGFKWQLAARSAVSTLISSVAGGIVPCILSYVLKQRKMDVSYIINGVLGSLVSITAYCALASPWESFIIGMTGSIMTIIAVEALDKLHIDDPVGCVGVHAVSGAWSLLTVGLFAKEDELSAALGIHHNHAGLFYGGGFYLLGVQLAGTVAMTAYSALTSYMFLKLLDLTMGLRMNLTQELMGADIVEHDIGNIIFDKVKNKVIGLKNMQTTPEELQVELMRLMGGYHYKIYHATERLGRPGGLHDNGQNDNAGLESGGHMGGQNNNAAAGSNSTGQDSNADVSSNSTSHVARAGESITENAGNNADVSRKKRRNHYHCCHVLRFRRGLKSHRKATINGASLHSGMDNRGFSSNGDSDRYNHVSAVTSAVTSVSDVRINGQHTGCDEITEQQTLADIV